MTQTARIEIPPKLIPLFVPPLGELRYRCAHGGRGSAKTRTFALMSAVFAFRAAQAGVQGVILCCREFMNSLDDSSMQEIKLAINSVPWLRDYFDIGEKYIRTKNRLVEYKFSGLRHSLDSVKSKARVLIAWIDEAETVSDMAWKKLRPTVREAGSEIWVTWNPEAENSATDRRFVKALPRRASVVTMNYHDNPFFTDQLEEERLNDLDSLTPEEYRWIWEGEYRVNNHSTIYADKWSVEEFAPQHDWDGPYYGLDFGFANDPTAAVMVWRHNDCLYIHHEAGRTKLEINDTSSYMAQRLPGIADHVVRCDSARPESISYLKKHGMPRACAVEKWQGSVEDGISIIRGYKRIYVHPRCTSVIDELTKYSYKVNDAGDVTKQVIDKHNHFLDALRYALAPFIRQNKKLSIIHESL